MKTQDYINMLQAKGFKLPEDARGFISFGQKYSGASDEIVNIAIEATLKHQCHFDGSYFIALLERLQQEKIQDRKSAEMYMRKLER